MPFKTEAADEAERAALVLRDGGYLSLATVGPDSLPWAAQAQYACSAEPLRLVFGSCTGSRHAAHINESRVVAASIALLPDAHGRLDGVQLVGSCYPVEGQQLTVTCELFYGQLFPDPRDRQAYGRAPAQLVGDAPHRLFELAIERLWVPDLDRWDREQVSARQEVELERVAKRLALLREQ